VTATITGGTVQVRNVGSNPHEPDLRGQRVLGGVGWWSGGSGIFSATLTHFRYRSFGSCVSYAASVHGTLSLTF
jgi:hypothetical protein